MVKISSKRIEQSDEQLIDVLDSMDDAFFIMDKDFVVLRANKVYERVSGLKREASVGKVLWDIFPDITQTGSPYWDNYHQVLRTRKSVKFIVFNRLKIWVEITAYPTKEGGVCVFIRDITARMTAEQALLKSEERFRALVNTASSVIYRMSADWNDMYQLDGLNFLADTARVDKNWIEKYIPKQEQKRVWAAINEAIREKKAFQLEHRVMQADGKVGWTTSRAVPILSDQGEIVEWFGAATDITSRKEAERAQQKQLEAEHRIKLVTQQRNALLKVNEAKDEFIALASHQLRTPATAAKQYMGLLLGNFAGELTDQQQGFLQIAYDNNERELKIINDLLKTAQMDGSGYDISTEECDIVDLVKNVISDLKDTIEQRKQHISLKDGKRHAKLLIDVTEIQLAISNLIENASKYSPEGSDIVVTITTTGKQVAIAVADQGVGIAKEDHQKIFEKFTRVSNVLSGSTSGNGLGLYWVRQIVEAHKGKISLKSALGKGSTFTVRLPL